MGGLLTGLIVGVAALVLGLRYGPVALRWLRRRRQRAWREDPTADPGEAHVTPEIREAVRALVARGPGDDPAAAAAEALRTCCVAAPCWYWREGLRQVAGWAARASEAQPVPDVLAVEAQLRAALGEIERAEELLAQLPADHWRGCVARAIVYEARGDVERAEAALVAAHELGPESERPWVLAQLGIDS